MATTPEPAAYALQISEQEIGRYRLMAARAVENESDMWQRAGVAAGARIVDVGCGPGAMLVELARRAGPTGEVVGVEPDAPSRAAAERAIAAEGMGAWARVVEGRGDDTGLAPGHWDVAMIRHVLFHVGPQAPAVVAHAASLLRPGGHLYLVDTYGDAMAIAPAETELMQQSRRYAEFQRSRGNDPNIGLRLHALLLEARLELTDHRGMFNIVPAVHAAHGGPLGAAQATMLAAGAITDEEAHRWEEARRRVAADPVARIFAPTLIAVGRRPG